MTSKIGHNKGPSLEPGAGWWTYCWKRSRNALVKKTMPLEVIRMRVRRAEQLGLAYPQYASVLLGSGRDIVGFLFTCDAMGLRLQRRLEMPDNVRTKLSGLVRCDRYAFAPSGENPDLFRAELNEVSGMRFATAGTPPRDNASWREARQAISDVLAPMKVPGNAVVLVGTKRDEESWVAAAQMAKFIPATEYFPR